MPDLLITFRSPLREVPVKRRRRWSRRLARGLAGAFILVGALALIDAGITLFWQEPISALYATLKQDHLRGALRDVERAPPTTVERRALAGTPNVQARVALLARALQHNAAPGSPVGRIQIPRIGANFVVVKGTRPSDLHGGPGIYPETGFPGIAGTTAIAGHRTTYLAPFRHIDALGQGSRILLDMPYAHFTYTVIGQRVVAPTDVGAATGNVGYTRLVLSACTPLFSAAKRLLVFARLTGAVPVGAALKRPGAVAAGFSIGAPLGASPAVAGTPPSRSSPSMLESLQP